MNIQDRMDMLKLLAETVQDVIRGGWMEHVEYREEDYRIRWQDDGTAILLRTNEHARAVEMFRFRVAVECSVVEPSAPEPNTPTGFVVTKPWKIIPAGWFVRAKTSGPWYEVISTARAGDSQSVMLRMPDGSKRDFMYGPDMKVECRRGTEAGLLSVENALDLLGEGAEIIQDPAEENGS